MYTVLLGVLATGAALGQPSATIVPEDAACPRCTIVGTVVTTLGDSDGPGALSGAPYVFADTRGRYWALIYDAAPTVFSDAGKFLKTIGRLGPGPGEFRMAIMGMTTPGDSVAIFDGSGQRTTIIGPDLTIGRMIRSPFQADGAVATRWPGEVIVNTIVPGGSGTLRRMSFAGALATEAAATIPDNGAAGTDESSIRQLAPSASGGVWAADGYRYRFSVWSAAGELLRAFERRPPWFPLISPRGTYGSSTKPPPPGIAAIREDPGTGDLWVFTRVAAPTWREAWPLRTSPGIRELSMRSIAVEKLFNTRVEVINTTMGQVLARGMLDDLVVSALPGNRVATYVVDSDGIPHVNIVALQIRAP